MARERVTSENVQMQMFGRNGRPARSRHHPHASRLTLTPHASRLAAHARLQRASLALRPAHAASDARALTRACRRCGSSVRTTSSVKCGIILSPLLTREPDNTQRVSRAMAAWSSARRSGAGRELRKGGSVGGPMRGAMRHGTGREGCRENRTKTKARFVQGFRTFLAVPCTRMVRYCEEKTQRPFYLPSPTLDRGTQTN